MLKLTTVFGTSLSVLLITFAMAAFLVQPAAAQSATSLKCKGCLTSKQLKNGKVKGKDLKDNTVTGSKIADGSVSGGDMSSNISLGTSSDAGNLGVKDTTGAETVSLDGATGNVTNLFSNITGSSNGLVKGWARIRADGTIVDCWRCSRDTAKTRKFATGLYFVDFTPVSTDLSGRPFVAILETQTDNLFTGGSANVSRINFELSVAGVNTRNSADSSADLGFTIVLF